MAIDRIIDTWCINDLYSIVLILIVLLACFRFDFCACPVGGRHNFSSFVSTKHFFPANQKLQTTALDVDLQGLMFVKRNSCSLAIVLRWEGTRSLSLAVVFLQMYFVLTWPFLKTWCYICFCLLEFSQQTLIVEAEPYFKNKRNDKHEFLPFFVVCQTIQT